MPTCVVSGCKNKLSKKLPGVTYHLFPKDPEVKDKWVKAIGRENWAPTRHSTVCSTHFREEVIDRTSLSYVRIRKGGVPSIFPALSKNWKTKGPKKTTKKIPVRKVRKERLQPVQEDLERNFITNETKEDTIISEPQTLLGKDSQLFSVDGRNEEFTRDEEHEMEEATHSTPICRLCASPSEDTISVFENEQSDCELLEKIHAYLPIMITAGDLLPTTVCQKCVKRLEVCHSLVQDCLDADAILKTVFGLRNSNQVQHSGKNVSGKQSCHNKDTLNNSMDERRLCEDDEYTNLTDMKFEVEDNDPVTKKQTSNQMVYENESMQNNDTFQKTNTVSLDARLEEESSALLAQVENKEPNVVDKLEKRRTPPNSKLRVVILRRKNQNKASDEVKLKETLERAIKALTTGQHCTNQKPKKRHKSSGITFLDECFVHSHEDISRNRNLEENAGHVHEQIAGDHTYTRKVQ